MVEAHQSMSKLWGEWLDAAGHPVPRNGGGEVAAVIEISPEFALTEDEFVRKARGMTFPKTDRLAIHADGTCLT